MRMNCTRCPRSVRLASDMAPESDQDWEKMLQSIGCQKTPEGWICDICSGAREPDTYRKFKEDKDGSGQ